MSKQLILGGNIGCKDKHSSCDIIGLGSTVLILINKSNERGGGGGDGHNMSPSGIIVL